MRAGLHCRSGVFQAGFIGPRAAVSFVEVDTLPDPVELIVTDPVDPEMEMLFPATIEVTPELVRTPELLVSPAPTRDVNDCPPMFRLVVDAVVNEA